MSKLAELLAAEFPHGDELFAKLTADELVGYDEKNYDYAGGGEDPNGNFNRVAATLAMYPGLKLSDPRVYALMLAMKQWDQVLWSLSRGFEGKIEGLDTRLFDIHVYIKIVRILNLRMQAEGKDGE